MVLNIVSIGVYCVFAQQMTKEADRSDTLLAEIKQINKERHSVQELQRQLTAEQQNSDSLKRELRDAKDRLLRSPSKYTLRDAEDQEKMDLKLQVEELQISLDENREEIDHLTEVTSFALFSWCGVLILCLFLVDH